MVSHALCCFGLGRRVGGGVVFADCMSCFFTSVRSVFLALLARRGSETRLVLVPLLLVCMAGLEV